MRIASLLILLLAASIQAEPPDLIPRALFFSNPQRLAPKLSPDGAQLGYLAPSASGVMNVWIESLAGTEARQLTQDEGQGIWDYDWAYDGVHVLYFQDRNGDENWHLFATRLDDGRTRDLTPFDGVAAENLILGPQRPTQALIGINRRDPTVFDMVRIELESGEIALEAENPGDVTDWAVDMQLRIRAATALDRENSDTILRVRDAESGDWRDLVRWPFLEVGSVLYEKILGFDQSGERMLVQTPIGSDKTRLAWFDVHTGKELATVAADSRSDVANFWWEPVLLLDPKTSEVQAVLFDYLIPEWRVFDDAVRADFAVLEQVSPGYFQISHRDAADRRWIVAFESDTHPLTYHLYDRETRQLRLLFESDPQLAAFPMAAKQPVTITARDGLQLPSYLTLPIGVEPERLPLILAPHGGPWARDYWYFEPWVQFLANRGYAVLQVNFRGSTGYGVSHINAGNQQWGGAMQHDLSDAVQWSIDQGFADPRRIAIYGGSYGGYATLAGLAFTPELYACGIDMVGPSNVATLLASFPPYWQVRKRRWELRVGPAETDEEFNRRISPLFHAAAMRAPLLIGHGANDPRVKLSESEAIVAALRARELPVEFVVYPDEGHGWVRPENNLDWAGRVEAFLARQLGGRAEPWTEVPGSSAEPR